MPDVSLCQQKSCQKRFDCIRYLGVASAIQTYMAPDPETCKHFWPLDHGALFLVKDPDVARAMEAAQEGEQVLGNWPAGTKLEPMGCVTKTDESGIISYSARYALRPPLE